MSTEILKEILAYIDEHIYEKISLLELAEMAGYSPFYFSKLFSEIMGMPITGYIRIRKLQYALGSLLEGRKVLDVSLMYMLFVDMPTLLSMFLVTALFLLGTNLGLPFFDSFRIIFGKKKSVSIKQLFQAKSAIKLAKITFLGMGFLESCISFMAIQPMGEGTLLFTGLSISISIALNGILYGLIGFLLLLPIQVRLEIMYMQKQEDSEKKTEDDAE